MKLVILAFVSTIGFASEPMKKAPTTPTTTVAPTPATPEPHTAAEMTKGAQPHAITQTAKNCKAGEELGKDGKCTATKKVH